MSKKRSRRAPLGVKLAAALLAVAVLAAVAVLLGRFVLGAARLAGTDGGPTERDPMFSEAPETVTRPPEPEENSGLGREDADPSAHWVVEEEGPVDQTAEELARELEAPPAAEAPESE